MTRILILGGLLSLLMTSYVAIAQTAPNPNQVSIQRITYAGKGCRQGTVSGNIAFDARAFTLTFNDFIAELGPNVPRGANSTHCTVTVDIRIPQGWSYTLFNADFRGYVALDAGARADLRTSYYFQANRNQTVRFNQQFRGYTEENFFKRDTVGIEDTVWSTCGRNRALNIETTVDLSNQGSQQRQGLFAIDSIDGSFTQVFGIRWMRC